MALYERSLTQDTKPTGVSARNALEASPVGQLVIDGTGSIMLVNRRFLSIAALQHGKNRLEHLDDIGRSLDQPTVPGDVPFDDVWRLVWTRISDTAWLGTLVSDGAPPSAARRARDPLTGLGDRQSLLDHWNAKYEGCGSYILYIDLDRFKQVNDTLGHEAGDTLLRNVAKRLLAVMRDGDVIARYGGDEFVALISGATDTSVVEVMADSLIEKLKRPFLIDGKQVSIGSSVGIAYSEGHDFREALRQADVALYESKRKGRGCATWYSAEMTQALEKRRELELALRRALLLEEFVVHFQPQYSFGSDSITGFEALVRWQKEDRIVPPAEFIPMAEAAGIIVALGAFVLERACQEASSWPSTLNVAVNVSPKQFSDDGFMQMVKDCLERSGLRPERLELELTESLLMDANQCVLDRMRALRNMGVGLSLDDFGTGNASLNYLRTFPFSKIKIDQSYVREPLADEASGKIIDAVARLGIDLGISVIAEGVETQEQMGRLQGQGVNSVQGFLLSRPIPAEEVPVFLSSWNQKTAESKQD